MKHNFKEGNLVIISRRPKQWNGYYTNNSPLSITYPFKATIEKLGKYTKPGDTIPCKIGGYGFCLVELIKDDIIKKIDTIDDILSEINDLIKNYEKQS